MMGNEVEEKREQLDEQCLKKCLEIAIDNRKFEIELLWKRALFFWGFIAALFVAVASLYDKNVLLTFMSALMGVALSFIWTLANRGSKAWQESWEVKAKDYFEQLYGYDKLYQKVTESQDEIIRLLRPRDYSLSRLLIVVSDLMFVFWMITLLYIAFGHYVKTLVLEVFHWNYDVTWLIVAGIFIVAIIWFMRFVIIHTKSQSINNN
ncbi:RipA family octameric membrane protein [Desertibacillus haloalkaliphilus]|uniref:RipA family octameric membrane protein n=1 Tax=Desertibacillus haloalkaliphilus TaxID=1328930 RepID=UPI001C26FA8A|nr:hypothetical protein [Desertibacillus haloalkaliphilus]MBU8906528.1 hypothetical protein [Desertibacillus haloalkaliphilus]